MLIYVLGEMSPDTRLILSVNYILIIILPALIRLGYVRLVSTNYASQVNANQVLCLAGIVA